MGLMNSRWLVSSLYVFLIATGGVLSVYLPIVSPIYKLFIIDIVLTVLVFIAGLVLKNDSMYDLYWSIIPFAMLFYWMYITGEIPENPRVVLLLLMLSWWSWRLSFNWFRGWRGMQHEDWRYVDLRQKTGRWYPIVSFFGIQLFPTLIVFVASWPMAYIFSSNEPLHLTDLIAVLLMVTGILLELFADRQMHAFRMDKSNTNKLISSGLWRYSRHPNYLGEITFWWGVYLLSLATVHNWWLLAGPLSVTLLFLFISIPLIEKRMVKRRPDYAMYQKSTSMLIPWLPYRNLKK